MSWEVRGRVHEEKFVSPVKNEGKSGRGKTIPKEGRNKMSGAPKLQLEREQGG